MDEAIAQLLTQGGPIAAAILLAAKLAMSAVATMHRESISAAKERTKAAREQAEATREQAAATRELTEALGRNARCALLLLLAPLLLLFTGCQTIEPYIQQADEMEQKTRAAKREVESAWAAVEAARDAWQEAAEAGDADTAAKALAAYHAAMEQHERQRLSYDATQAAAEHAWEELQRAREEGNPWQAGLALLGGLLMGVFGDRALIALRRKVAPKSPTDH
jgi:hypothetical protein